MIHFPKSDFTLTSGSDPHELIPTGFSFFIRWNDFYLTYDEKFSFLCFDYLAMISFTLSSPNTVTTVSLERAPSPPRT